MTLSESVKFGHFYRKLTTETKGIYWKNAALNPLVSRWSLPFEFSICGRKQNKRANSHNFKIKNLNQLTITFLAVYLMNRGKSSYKNESSIRVNNTFREIIECFWRKHCRDSPCQTCSVVFQIFLRFFFLTCSLIDRYQIVTDTSKNTVSKFVWKPFKSPLSSRKW